VEGGQLFSLSSSGALLKKRKTGGEIGLANKMFFNLVGWSATLIPCVQSTYLFITYTTLSIIYLHRHLDVHEAHILKSGRGSWRCEEVSSDDWHHNTYRRMKLQGRGDIEEIWMS